VRRNVLAVTVLVALLIIHFYGLRAQQTILIDGDVSDWDALGIQPVYTDPFGDTEAWSKDPSTLKVGSTAELPEKVAANDKCRDLKALYIWCDEEWVYIRLDVAELYEGWSLVSTKATGEGEQVTYPNVSAYHIYFDLTPGVGQKDSAAASDVDFQKNGYEWEFNIQFDAGLYGENYGKPFMQFPDWSIVTIEDFDVDLARSAFETRISKTLLKERFGELGTARVFVGSIKPGEPKGNWGTWAHAFDPQHPGCPGEAAWGACGPENDRGSDFADVMPNDSLEPPSGGWWEDWLSHVTNTITVNLAPTAKAAAPTLSWAWIAAGIILAIVVMIVVAYYMLKRKA
jgi:hypothetical protein